MKLLNLLLTDASNKENEENHPLCLTLKRNKKKQLSLKGGWKGCGYPGGVSGIAKLIYKQRQLCRARNLAEALSAAAFSLTPLEGHLGCNGEAKGHSCYY